MPTTTKKYVELSCSQSLRGFLLPLCFNLCLLVTCSVHGFLTRKLPQNFNESWYIFVSMATTIFIWIVFLPTFFTTFYSYHRVALLSLCLILNSFITLLTLYFPKMYAVYFVEESKIKFETTLAMASTISQNQVAATPNWSISSGWGEIKWLILEIVFFNCLHYGTHLTYAKNYFNNILILSH